MVGNIINMSRYTKRKGNTRSIAFLIKLGELLLFILQI